VHDSPKLKKQASSGPNFLLAVKTFTIPRCGYRQKAQQQPRLLLRFAV